MLSRLQIYGLTFGASVEAELLEEMRRCNERLADWDRDDLQVEPIFGNGLVYLEICTVEFCHLHP